MKPLRSVALCIIIILLQIGAGQSQDVSSIPEPTQSVSAEPQKILFLNTYEIGLPIPDSIDRGFVTGLTEGGGSVNDLFIEHLDFAREPSSKYRVIIADLLRHKLEGKHVGIVIAEGTPAVNFLNTEAKDLFPDAQLITLISPDIESLPDTSQKIINIPWLVDAAGTLSLALNLFPKTRRVVIVTGSRDDILPFLKEAQKAFTPWKDKLVFEYTNQMTYEQMMQRISSLPPNSIIIYSPYFSDVSGRSFVPAEVVVKICQVATAPVFSTMAPFLGHGIVGGSLLKTEMIGEQAAKITLDYLNGRLKLDKPITNFNVSTQKIFDWNMLTHWNADISALPEDSIFINRPRTLWRQYRNEVYMATAVFLFLCSVVLALWILNRRLKRLAVSVSNSELHYRSLFDNSLIGVTVTNESFIFVDVNDAFCKMLEYSREELVGKMTISDITHPDDVAISMAMLGNLMKHDIEQCSIEKRFVSKTGKILSTLIYVRGCYSSLGEYVGTTASVLDITERKKVEDSLSESNKKFALAFNNAPILITISKLNDGIYLDVNQRFLDTFGFNREEVVGRSSLELCIITESQREQILNTIKEKGQIDEVEFVLHTKFDKEVLFKYWGSIITISNQDCLLSIALDITEHRRMEQQFQQAQKMESVGRLAGGVAHDFNNMLGVILGHAEMAMDEVAPTHPLFAELEEIRKAATRSADLTRQLLAFARRQTIAPRVLDLNETIEGMLKMLRRLIGEDIDLVWMPGAGLWPIKVDSSQLDQILANLCINAKDAIAGVGKIMVETGNSTIDDEYCETHPGCVPGDYVRIAVSDTGCGMDALTLAHIFEPFFTTKGVGEGTGLGLSTVYGAVKQNSGFVYVYSEPGQGTVFSIYLPRFIKSGMAGEKLNIGENEPAVGGHETILLVEDEPAILKMALIMLRRLGYKVMAASNPSEAIRLVEKFDGEIHLLMTDIVMPEMNGRDLAERIMTIKKGMRCLFMSGYSSDIITNQGKLVEGTHFIQKPFSRKKLAIKLRQVLSPVEGDVCQ